MSDVVVTVSVTNPTREVSHTLHDLFVDLQEQGLQVSITSVPLEDE